MSGYAVIAEHLSKRFWLDAERHTSIKERVVRRKMPTGREFWALRDASFEIERGSTFGMVGQNGSGKSTTLKVLAGIYRPTSGRVVVDGRVSALLELGAGFHADLTGRENIRLNGAILGLAGKQIDAAMDRIIDFAGLGEFIDSPVKIYSSGMYVRLGFAIAVSLDPEILMVDEVIAVGDEEFQRKCNDHLFQLRKRGTTIVLVTHSMSTIRDLCDKAVWLEHGRIRQLGASADVVDGYLKDVNAREVEAHREVEAREVPAPAAEPATESIGRPGSGEVRITSMEFRDGDGNSVPSLVSGAPSTIRVHYAASEDVGRCIFGIGFWHESGAYIAGPNSSRAGDWRIERGHGYVEFVVDELLLSPASYRLTGAVADRGHNYDLADREFELHVRGRGDQETGIMRMPGTWRGPVTVTKEAGSAILKPESARVES